MTGDPADIPIPEPLRAQYRVSFIRFQSPTAVLFEGVDPEHGRTVLVKVMRPDPTASPADRQRVRRELQKLVQVRHPALVPVLDLGEEGDLTWIVRPFVPGETLAERIAARGRLSDVEAATLGLHLAAGLGELHRHGLLHRDLRPGHVLLGQDGGVYLIDAGLGRTFLSPDGRALVGFPGYAAPEAILGRLMSFRSDLYSLGVVLYEALSGMPPYMALDPRRMMQLQCETDPEPLDPSVPPALTRLVSTLLARDPRERPMSAQIVERQLEPMVPSAQPAAQESDIEFGERTVMTESAESYMEQAAPVPAPPIESFPQPTPPPSPSSAPPRQPVYKQTMMGMAPDMPVPLPEPAARVQADRSGPVPVPAQGPLDYDDVVDTNQNEASRVFGIPATAQGAGGSAVPPFVPEPPPPSPPNYAAPPFAPPPNADPKSGPRVAPPPYGEAPGMANPAPMAYPPPQQPAPQEMPFEPPASHTVAMDAPPPAAFAGYAPNPSMPPGPPQGLPGWSPYGPAMGMPPGQSYAPPAPAPPPRSSGAWPWLIGFLVLVGVAGGAGFLAARARRDETTPPTTPTPPTPPTPPAQPPLPTVAPTVPDAGTMQAAVDVPAATTDVVVAAADLGSPVAQVIDAGPPVAVTLDAGAPPPVVAAVLDAGSTAPEPRPATPRPTTPRPTTPRVTTVPRPTAADAGAAVTPLNDAIRRQDWATARRLLGEHLRAHPGDAAAHAQQGYVLDRLGDANGALAEYRAATRLDRRNTRYLHRLADLQMSTGDRAGAVATLQQILRINPQEPAARARLEQIQPH